MHAVGRWRRTVDYVSRTSVAGVLLATGAVVLDINFRECRPGLSFSEAAGLWAKQRYLTVSGGAARGKFDRDCRSAEDVQRQLKEKLTQQCSSKDKSAGESPSAEALFTELPVLPPHSYRESPVGSSRLDLIAFDVLRRSCNAAAELATAGELLLSGRVLGDVPPSFQTVLEWCDAGGSMLANPMIEGVDRDTRLYLLSLFMLKDPYLWAVEAPSVPEASQVVNTLVRQKRYILQDLRNGHLFDRLVDAPITEEMRELWEPWMRRADPDRSRNVDKVLKRSVKQGQVEPGIAKLLWPRLRVIILPACTVTEFAAMTSDWASGPFFGVPVHAPIFTSCGCTIGIDLLETPPLGPRWLMELFQSETEGHQSEGSRLVYQIIGMLQSQNEALDPRRGEIGDEFLTTRGAGGVIKRTLKPVPSTSSLREPQYILDPAAGVIEFLPLGERQPVDLQNTTVGREYELVLSFEGRPLRQRSGDVVRVAGKYFEAPIVSFTQRLS
mmetsp:Transcript_6671/g.14414  ORF Transcript_6671/g.14414 Transcript_6671/m.14414 type:complete len:497 (+) Transcript_6671:81-1571(+)